MVRSRMHGLSSRADRGASEKLEFLIYFLDPVTLGRESSCWRPELPILDANESFRVQNVDFSHFLDVELVLSVRAPLTLDAFVSLRVQGTFFIPINRLSIYF